MVQFNVHFFKEKNNEIDFERIRMHFDDIDGFKESFDDTAARFEYTHPRLGHQAAFVVTPKTQVPDIYRLNPKYLDVNFHLEMPILTPDYVARHLFDFVRGIYVTFQLHIYNEMLENVLPYRQETLFKAFQMVKDAYINKNTLLMKDYHLLPKDKLTQVLRYMDDQSELRKYYKEQDTAVPGYHFLKNEKSLVIGIEWIEQTLTIFPPRIDVVFLRSGDQIRVIPYGAIKETAGKYLDDVPGFIKGTKVITRKNLKKVCKILKKTTSDIVGQTYTKETVMHLLD